MTIDLLGGIFSDLSLVFKKDVDVIAAVVYSLVVVGFQRLLPFDSSISPSRSSMQSLLYVLSSLIHGPTDAGKGMPKFLVHRRSSSRKL